MKRYNYTITELLTVIAIIAILAAIAIPSVGYARRRARTSACISNQGQTLKTILNSLADTNNRLYSGSIFDYPGEYEDDEKTKPKEWGWTVALAEKGYIKNMDSLRCPDIRSYTTDGKTIDENSIDEAYGLVVASGNGGKFDFRGSKLFTKADKTQIAPSILAMGGCATSDGKKRQALLDLGEGNKKVEGKPTGVHHNDSVNMFFYDGHAENLNENNYKENKYFPKQTSKTAGEAVAVGSVWLDAKK